ncbi:MAG: hypothetical protein HZA81_02255 [Candidatus Taylorbacteria bacterium]|nr:hypothetical protein [Candidatus Taylorbacteria bacterium]
MSRYHLVSDRVASPFFCGMVLRDEPPGTESIQANYLNMLLGMFLRKLVRVYSPDELSEEDRAKMRKYLERIFEAKDNLSGKEPAGGMYKREV